MSSTFRVTFREWQQFEVFVPAKTTADAVLIAETLRHSIDTVSPIIECDGGTEAFEAAASATDPLTIETVTVLDAVLPMMQREAQLSCKFMDARAVRLLRTALNNAKRGAS